MVIHRRRAPYRRRYKRVTRPVFRRRRPVFRRNRRVFGIQRQLFRGDAVRLREVQTDNDLKFLATSGNPTLHAITLQQSTDDVKAASSLYKFYRLRCVVVKHIPRWDNSTFIQQGTTTTGAATPIVALPMWKVGIWHLPAAPGNGDMMLQQQHTSFTRITYGKTLKFKPNNYQGIAIAGGSAQWNESTPIYDKWIETADQTAPYYGIAYHMPDAVSSGITGTPVLFTRIFYKYWEFKSRV